MRRTAKRILRSLRPVARTGFAFLSLALFTSSLALHLVHVGAVRHSICAEHGELVEGGTTEDAHAGAAGEKPAAADDQHAHCPLALGVIAASTIHFEHVLAVERTAATADAPREVLGGLDALTVAPKTSPPA